MPQVASRAPFGVARQARSPSWNSRPWARQVQSAAAGVPVLSLDVATEVLEENGGGMVANGDLDQLATWLKEFWTDRDASRELGRLGRRFVEQHCDLKVIIDELALRLEQLKPPAIDP